MSLLAVSVEVALVVGVLVVLLVDMIWSPPRRVLGVLAGASLAVALAFAWLQWDQAVRHGAPTLQFSDMIAVDGFAALGGLVIILVAAAGLAAAWDLVEELDGRAAEFIVVLLLAASGVHLMAASANLIMLFLSLEIASISLYVLAGFTRERVAADEAALKYFLLGAFASAVFLYGIALVYAATGTTSLYGVGAFLSGNVLLRPAILLAGVALVLVGLGFKVSAAPFHMWAPDVYQGAPGGVVGFMAAAAKIGGFAALARLLTVPFVSRIDDWAPALALLAAISVVVGTALAIAQTDIKRMLAYSSVAHAGFILTGLVAGAEGVPAMWFYTATYAFQALGAFAVAAVVGGMSRGRSALTDYAGLSARSPALAGLMALFMVAMGGIPLTSGFVGKAAVFQAAIDAGYLWLVIIGVLAAVAGLFFYLRVIVLMYMQAPALAEAPGAAVAVPEASLPAKAALAFAIGVTIAFGIVPWPLLDAVRDALPI